MKLIIDKKIIELKECKNFKSRLIGNMFKKNIEPLLFEKCKSIHTFFMTDNIDILFLDEDNKIIKECKNLKPFRICMCRNAKKVIELPKNSIEKNIKVVI